VQGKFEKEGREEEVLVSLKRGQKKIVKRNKNEYEKLAEHIGAFPLVMISPMDTVLITGGGGERRRFVDGIISQFDKRYLEKLISYNGILQQRNALLKQFAMSRSFDGSLLEVLDEQISETGNYVHEARIKFLVEFTPVFEKFYRLPQAQPAGLHGAGLGLAICKGVVEAHGGEIMLSDRAGGGTLATIRLPLDTDAIDKEHPRWPQPIY